MDLVFQHEPDRAHHGISVVPEPVGAHRVEDNRVSRRQNRSDALDFDGEFALDNESVFGSRVLNERGVFYGARLVNDLEELELRLVGERQSAPVRAAMKRDARMITIALNNPIGL